MTVTPAAMCCRRCPSLRQLTAGSRIHQRSHTPPDRSQRRSSADLLAFGAIAVWLGGAGMVIPPLPVLLGGWADGGTTYTHVRARSELTALRSSRTCSPTADVSMQHEASAACCTPAEFGRVDGLDAARGCPYRTATYRGYWHAGVVKV